MSQCEWCNPIVAGLTCTLFETTLLMLGWTESDAPVIKVTLPWGVIEDFQVFAPAEKKTYYEPGNETNFRTVVYMGRTEDQKAVFKICKPKFGIDSVIAVASAISGGVVMWGISLLKNKVK